MVSPDRSRAGSRPVVGLYPATPHQAAGMRVDPAPSLPVASGTMPAATAAAEPAEEPPGLSPVRHGLAVRPRAVAPQVFHSVPGPGTEVVPTGTQPARSSRPACTDPEPSLCLKATGTPASGGRPPTATSRSTARARRTALAAHTPVKALTPGSSRSTAPSAARAASRALTSPPSTRSRMPAAESGPSERREEDTPGSFLYRPPPRRRSGRLRDG